MATSADTLSTIIATLAKKYKFDNDKALSLLADKELLPKKMLPKISKSESIWASKKAQELAEKHGIVPTGTGSSKTGKFTLPDVAKLLISTPTATKTNISPDALVFANANDIKFAGKTGSGKDGRILLKDVKSWMHKNIDDIDDLQISTRALLLATEKGVTQEQLASIHGSGKEGRILLEDIIRFTSHTEDEKSDSESDDDCDDIDD